MAAADTETEAITAAVARQIIRRMHVRPGIPGKWLETSLVPTAETAALADIAREVIARYVPAYRELLPEIASMPVPNVLTITPGVRTGADSVIVELTLAELLFENTRRW